MQIQCFTPTLETATQIAAAAFVKNLSPELRLDVEQHLASGHIIYSLVEDDRSISGLSIFDVLGDDSSILYLSGIILMPHAQGKEYAVNVIAQAQSMTNTRFLALRTQSPRMWSAGRKACATWYPSPNAKIPDSILKIGYELVGKPIASYPAIPGFYGGALYGKKPTHADTALQTWWDSICNFERGDSIVCIGTF